MSDGSIKWPAADGQNGLRRVHGSHQPRGLRLHGKISCNPLLHFGAMLELIGVQFILMGLLGEVLTRTYFESQGKTAYAVRATINLDRPAGRKAA